MKDLPREVAIEIYKKKYWKGTGLMNIKNFAVALTIFDFQVNSGIRGAKIAQKTANRLYQNRNEEEIAGYRHVLDIIHENYAYIEFIFKKNGSVESLIVHEKKFVK